MTVTNVFELRGKTPEFSVVLHIVKFLTHSSTVTAYYATVLHRQNAWETMSFVDFFLLIWCGYFLALIEIWAHSVLIIFFKFFLLYLACFLEC